jgi:dolichol-phosphate mannosyltransferase
MTQLSKIGVVIPVYGCKIQLIELYLRLKEVLSGISEDFEIIMVNDKCPQDSWGAIIDLCKRDKRVKGINLSRNFGQHYAITAGLKNSNSEWVVVMDCDLQDRPEEIPALYNKALEGYDVVLGRRLERKDNFIKRSLSKLFYKFLSYLTETEQDSTIGNFGIYNKKVIEAVCSMGDHIRYFPTMVKWVGFNQTSIKIDHAKREQGKSSYSFHRLLLLSLDVMISFSDKPMKLVVKLGLTISLTSLIFALYTIVKYFAGDIKIMGWTSLIISIWFLSGIIVFILGIIGLYLGKTFEKVKDRPSYIIKDYLNKNE